MRFEAPPGSCFVWMQTPLHWPRMNAVAVTIGVLKGIALLGLSKLRALLWRSRPIVSTQLQHRLVPCQGGEARPDYRLAQNAAILLGQVPAGAQPTAGGHHHGCNPGILHCNTPRGRKGHVCHDLSPIALACWKTRGKPPCLPFMSTIHPHTLDP